MARKLVTLSALALLVFLAGGCESGPPGAGPWMDLPPDNFGESSAVLFFTLSERQGPIDQNCAYHAFLVWIDGKDESKNFGQRIETLEGRNVVPASWHHDPLKPLTRSRLAAMVCRHLDVKGSIALWGLGPYGRFARRELEFREVMIPGGGDADPVGAAEFVNVLKRADEMIAHADREGQPETGPGTTEEIE